MAEAKDPLLRQIALLQLIPRAPRRISTTTLQEKLRDWGFEIDVRSLQRDLNRLVALDFPIERHDWPSESPRKGIWMARFFEISIPEAFNGSFSTVCLK